MDSKSIVSFKAISFCYLCAFISSSNMLDLSWFCNGCSDEQIRHMCGLCGMLLSMREGMKQSTHEDHLEEKWRVLE